MSVVKARAMRDEDKLEKRQQILDAAEKLFLAAQPKGTLNMDELAETAKVAKGTLYLYFPSKEEVLLAVHERSVHRVLDGLYDAIKDKTRITMDEMVHLAHSLMVESPLYLPLATLALSYISHAVPVETVMRVHATIGERLGRTGASFERLLNLAPGEGPRFLQYTHSLVLGLWQLSGCGRLLPESAKAADPHVKVFVKEDRAEYSRALTALWTGMLGANFNQPRRTAKTRTKKSKSRSR
jgi:AcrR family transcriptional regulator